jgi:hypothetical protein
MKIGPLLAAFSLVLVNVGEAHGASPVAGGVQPTSAVEQRLETARANLATAVQRIEKDPPSTEDLDAAQAAVGALKDAIDAGAELEPKDLEYAKAALAARKELRTHREYVEKRRANVHLHNHRRTIDAALTNLSDPARRLEGKAPSTKDFDDARAAAQALKNAVDAARPFAKQDQKFASYLVEADAALARHEKAIDDRSTSLLADKHRALVEESRQALSASMGALGTGSNDAQFEGADRAASLLSKRLEEGKGFEAKDKTYRSDAERARAELAQAKKRMEDLWNETGLARLKSEMEPAYKDLAAAGRALAAKNPTADQLAEARTAAIVVRKLLEKFQPRASGNQAVGQYLLEVKNTLIEVEIELQRRNLDSARADLAQALKNIEKKAPTDEHFEEAKTAMVVLEKTLETLHTKAAAMAKPVADARELLRTARKTMAERRVEVDMQRHRAKIEEAKRNAVALVGQAHKANTGTDQLNDAENAVKQVRVLLDEGAALARKDRELAKYHREVKERIAELADRIAKRRLMLAAGDARAQLNEAISGAKSKVEAAKKPEATDADLEAAAQSVDAVIQAMEARAPLEKQDKGYAAHADRARNEYARLVEGLEFAKHARALRRQTAEALAEGASAADAAAALQNLRAQKEHYEKALAQFRACESASSMVQGNRMLASLAVLVDGRPSTAKEVIALCSKRLEPTEQLLNQVVALIRFEEGPKRSFETGKGLLAQNKKSEALGQFDECISSGLILQNRNPQLKDRKFEVAGSTMTLSELTKQCISQSKALRPR